MANTQSGFPVLDRYGHPDLDVNASVYGVKFPGGIRKGDVAAVLLYVAGRWHKEIEKLTAGHCWGYAHREIRGGSGWSNHAGGTAIDINAPKHPQYKDTLSAAQKRKARAIRDALGGVVIWGGDWSAASLDQMHWEIAPSKGRGKLAEVASRIRSGQLPNTPPELTDSKPTPTPTPTPTGRVYEVLKGDKLSSIAFNNGTTVKEILALNPSIKNPDYIVVGQKITLPAKKAGSSPWPLTGNEVFGTWNEPGWAKRTRSGDARWDGEDIRVHVRKIQRAVNVTADGIYGPKTRAGVVAFQNRNGLIVDGLVGKATWTKLGV